MADAERLTVPEYLALLHYHAEANESDEPAEPFSPAELDDAFLRMERAGIARIH